MLNFEVEFAEECCDASPALPPPPPANGDDADADQLLILPTTEAVISFLPL